MKGKESESSFIFALARSAAKSIEEGYYRAVHPPHASGLKPRSLRDALISSKTMPLLAEIKFTSPAEGKLRPPGDVKRIAMAYERGGVAGISVLTEPKHFDGDIRYLPLVKRSVKVPVLMKDIIIDPVQIESGARMGADAVLFIAAIFMNRLSRKGLEEMLSAAHAAGLEVLMEAHTENEFAFALESDADVVGINNRNLETLDVSLATSRRLLSGAREVRKDLSRSGRGKPVISESGIRSRKDIEELKQLGADGFLVGSALMKSRDLEAKVRSLTGVAR
ncbi:MAG TPA: indole-3-glycerol-phosphate synthase [Nitrososphaerales archaeon]|nr:indole-3-glycerol-phosphate synthase [Nitrososphaerales archaeon]